MALPLPLRNHVADLILRGLHDGRAREELGDLARGVDIAGAEHAAELRARASRGERVLASRSLSPAEPTLREVLDAAADLFDARLYFEVHELLEPYWMRAQGSEREAAQGLIQAAVALEHLTNGNLRGARSLLSEAVRKLRGRELAGVSLEPFARGLDACLAALLGDAQSSASFDWSAVPRFPAGAQ